MYMSYCRFEGTHSELRACIDSVFEHVNGMTNQPLSESESKHFKGMVKEFVDFLIDFDLLDDEGYLDDEKLTDLCESITDYRK